MRNSLICVFVLMTAVGNLSAVAEDNAAGPSRAAGSPVKLDEDRFSFTLANDYVSARVDKRSGDLVSLKYHGLEMLGRASGHPFAYWAFVGAGSRLTSRGEAEVVLHPDANDGERAVVVCRFPFAPGNDGLPADVMIGYALGRGDSGVYTFTYWHHKPDYPGFSVAEARYVLKLNSNVLDYLTIDANRRRVMPTPYDWDHGVELNMKEVRRLTTGKYQGEVEHKYDYSAIQFDTPAYGWSSTQDQVGIWIVNPSIEYLSGGATKVELTGHLDVNPGGAPTLLNYWKGSHFGGSSLAVREGESWSKFVGPFLIYCNAAPGQDAMWKDALAKADAEARAWPYAWLAHPQYPLSRERGAVSGQIAVNDPLAPDERVSNMLVGLAPPDYTTAGFRQTRTTVDWQLDAKFYQFWTRADAQGRFTIPHVRPGTYTLHAIADGVLGEFSLPQIEVAAGQSRDLARLDWQPERRGRQLWEIGVPDRSAAEFRHGDHYWKWGLYNQYADEFPDDVAYVVGESDWRRDWNYCQPPRVVDGKVTGTTWSIAFDLPQAAAGKATLRLAIAGAEARRGIEVTVNGAVVGSTGPLPNTGVMHWDGIRGYWAQRSVAFDAALLTAGRNIIQLHAPAFSWHDGVLYDYLRLELDSAAGNDPRDP